tara:strand:- start:250 stop:378 length:129 start_codon:yes stop_codon:yes gene_type:complete
MCLFRLALFIAFLLFENPFGRMLGWSIDPDLLAHDTVINAEK